MDKEVSMTLRHFKIFVTVCDTMNMTAAGEKLYLSQSAVSQAVAELEKYYDTRLFDRLSKKLYLTQSGRKLLSYARHIVHMNEETELEMRMLQECGYIRIGASVTVCTCILPKIVAKFQKIKLNAKTEVYENNTENIENMLLQDQIDIGVVEGIIHSSDIITTPFMQDRLVLICGKQHRFHNRASVSITALENENFIIREPGSGTRNTFEEVMNSHHIRWHAGWTCNNTDTIKRAVAEGLGISVISERAVQNEIERGELIKLTVDNIEFLRDFTICYHKNKFLSEIMKQFISVIEAV
jgi:Transcriptional regulator